MSAAVVLFIFLFTYFFGATFAIWRIETRIEQVKKQKGFYLNSAGFPSTLTNGTVLLWRIFYYTVGFLPVAGFICSLLDMIFLGLEKLEETNPIQKFYKWCKEPAA